MNSIFFHAKHAIDGCLFAHQGLQFALNKRVDSIPDILTTNGKIHITSRGLQMNYLVEVAHPLIAYQLGKPLSFKVIFLLSSVPLLITLADGIVSEEVEQAPLVIKKGIRQVNLKLDRLLEIAIIIVGIAQLPLRPAIFSASALAVLCGAGLVKQELLPAKVKIIFGQSVPWLYSLQQIFSRSIIFKAVGVYSLYNKIKQIKPNFNFGILKFS